MDHLFSISKKDYARGKRPNVDCILCSIVKDDENENSEIEKLVVFQTKLTTVSVNLYPYNSGHLIIFPNRHIEDIRKLSDEESYSINQIMKMSIDILEKLYKPSGFNIGYNLGDSSGASIKHIHMHLVPRFKSELGFIDLIGGAKILIEHPHETCTKLKNAFRNYNINFNQTDR